MVLFILVFRHTQMYICTLVHHIYICYCLSNKTPERAVSRLSIEVTPEQHQLLKAMAALQGKSIKDFILDKVLPQQAEEQPQNYSVKQLETLLQQRLTSAHNSNFSEQSVMDIFGQAITEHDKR